MSRPLDPGARLPRFDLPGIPDRLDSGAILGRPFVLEFHRGTW